MREKEIGTIEQLMVTPIRTGELFLAKTAPTLAVGLLSVFPSLLIVWWFGVPLRGSLPLFLALTALFLVSAIGLGVLVAAVTHTLQQALLLSFFGLFPMMFLSGTLVPIESMPKALQYLSLASPLRYYMDIILGIFSQGHRIHRSVATSVCPGSDRRSDVCGRARGLSQTSCLERRAEGDCEERSSAPLLEIPRRLDLDQRP